MNKYVVAVVVMVVLMVGLAEIYLALTLDQNVSQGQWRLSFNWTLHADPSSKDIPPSWSRFFYTTQVSTKISNNGTVFEANHFQLSVNATENTTKSEDRKIGESAKTISELLPSRLEKKSEELSDSDYSILYPDCGFQPPHWDLGAERSFGK